MNTNNEVVSGEVVSNPESMTVQTVAETLGATLADYERVKRETTDKIAAVLASSDPEFIEAGIKNIREDRRVALDMQKRVGAMVETIYAFRTDCEGLCSDLFQSITKSLKAHAEKYPKAVTASNRNADADEARKLREVLRGQILAFVKEGGEVSRGDLIAHCQGLNPANTEAQINLSIMFLKEMGELFSTGSGQKSRLTVSDPKSKKAPKGNKAK